MVDDNSFSEAVSSIVSGTYDNNDKKTVKRKIESLKTEEYNLKKQLEREKNAYVRKKEKLQKTIKSVNGEIRTLKTLIDKT